MLLLHELNVSPNAGLLLSMLVSVISTVLPNNMVIAPPLSKAWLSVKVHSLCVQ